MQAADKETIASMLINVGHISMEIEQIRELALKPVIISGIESVVVDVLMILKLCFNKRS